MTGSSSLLLRSLRVYLNNQDRLQPIIGLTSVTECVKADTGGVEVLYLCEACASRLSKADIRSHIMGSLHRCNYIKVWHPYVMGGWEITDLSKLAWPLMEMARVLEKQEGPGDVQVMEMDSAAYKMMTSLSEAEAIRFLHAVKDGRWAQLCSSVQTACSPPAGALAQSQKPPVDSAQSREPSVEMDRSPAPPPARTTPTAATGPRMWQKPSVDFTQSQKPAVYFTQSLKQTVEMDRPTAPPPARRTPAIGRLENSVTLPGTYQMPPEPPAGQSEHSDVFLDGYADTKPIIGLDRLVECRGEEDGRPHCFLCHCCRVKTLGDGIIRHLTSSSHYYNYMVKWLPTSLCIQLTGNSYHWCIKTLGDGNAWTPWSLQGPGDGAAEASGIGGTRKHAAELSRQGRKRKARGCRGLGHLRDAEACRRAVEAGTKEENDPVFKVSLPLNYGPLVLERTSFSLDALPALPPADPSPSPEPQPQPGDQEFTSGPLFSDRHDDFCEDADTLGEQQELQHELFGEDPDTLGEQRESQRELFGEDPDTLAEEDQHEEWNSWDTWGHQEDGDGYFTDRDQPRNPAEESRRINVWLN